MSAKVGICATKVGAHQQGHTDITLQTADCSTTQRSRSARPCAGSSVTLISGTKRLRALPRPRETTMMKIWSTTLSILKVPYSNSVKPRTMRLEVTSPTIIWTARGTIVPNQGARDFVACGRGHQWRRRWSTGKAHATEGTHTSAAIRPRPRDSIR